MHVDLSAVGLFPLPSVVHFPRAVLPLHVFEDRYRAMTADALEGDALIAMALLKPGWEKSYYARPAIEPVVCVGRIISHEKLPDGKYNFLLEGLLRARIIRELPIDVAYRVAELRRIECAPAAACDLDAQRSRLNALFANSALSSAGVGRQFRRMLDTGWPTADIADLCAFTLLDDVQLKQSLLAEADELARVTRLADALEKAAQSLPKTVRARSPADPSMN